MSHDYDVIDNQLYMTLQKSKFLSFLDLMDLNWIKVIYYPSRAPKGGRYINQIHRDLSEVRKFIMDQKFLWLSFFLSNLGKLFFLSSNESKYQDERRYWCLDRLSIDESRDWLVYGILPVGHVTFSVKYKFSIKCNSSFWSTQNGDSKYVLLVKCLQRKPYLGPINDLVVKMTTFSIEYKKWSCYT